MCPRYPPVARRQRGARRTTPTSPHEKGRTANGYGPSRYATATSAAPSIAETDDVTITGATSVRANALTRNGSAFPTVSAPTIIPIARPRRARNHVAAIFIAGG